VGSAIALYQRLVAARIRSDWQYRVSFFTFLAAQALVTMFDFITIVLLFRLVPTLGGWTGVEVAFLYGLATVPFGVSDVVVSPVERLSRYVQQGDFDRLLLRPVPPLVQLAATEFELRRIGKVVPSLAVLIWAVTQVEVDWTPAAVLTLAVALVAGTVVYSALWVVTAAFSFWAVATQQATNAATYGGQQASQYPLHLYRNWIRAILGWAIPLAFVAYVPALSILGADNPLGLSPSLVYASLPVSALTAAVAMLVWRAGIGHYQSTGS
jgi:ABC-2 type transport system permease protein